MLLIYRLFSQEESEKFKLTGADPPIKIHSLDVPNFCARVVDVGSVVSPMIFVPHALESYKMIHVHRYYMIEELIIHKQHWRIQWGGGGGGALGA